MKAARAQRGHYRSSANRDAIVRASTWLYHGRLDELATAETCYAAAR